MKVAITSTGDSLDSAMDPRFGRCAFFALYDTETKKVEFILNTAKTAEEGAGSAAVQIVAPHQVVKIISGDFGVKIKSLLTDLKIQMIVMKQEKTIKEIIDLLNQQV